MLSVTVQAASFFIFLSCFLTVKWWKKELLSCLKLGLPGGGLTLAFWEAKVDFGTAPYIKHLTGRNLYFRRKKKRGSCWSVSKTLIKPPQTAQTEKPYNNNIT